MNTHNMFPWRNRKKNIDIFRCKICIILRYDGCILRRYMFLFRFRTTQTAYPVSDAVNHAIIRSYIQRGQIDTLFSILRDKV